MFKKRKRRLGGWYSKGLLLGVLGAGKSKLKVPADLVCGERPPAGSQAAVFSLGPQRTGRVSGLPGVSFTRAQSHSRGLHSPDVITPQSPTPCTVTLGVRSSAGVGWGTHVVSFSRPSKAEVCIVRSPASPAALQTTPQRDSAKPSLSHCYLFEGKNMFCPVYFQNNLAQSLVYHELFL